MSLEIQSSTVPDGTIRRSGRLGDGRTTSGAERAASTGRFIHEVIAGLARINPGPSPVEILTYSGELSRRYGSSLAYRRHAHALAGPAAAVYFRFFRQPEFEFVDAELSLDVDSRCDLIWRLPSGCLLIDEVKTGVAPTIGWSATEQVLKYIDRASAAYGDAFEAIRVCWLRSPARSRSFDRRGLVVSEGARYVR